ncbi:Dihydrolipoyllysine-residue acetyltransferase component of pyruvate dehydrogenase complex [Candidatus Portiera aleyrodidarum]|uniref:2-oxo acid dehydrogenase subunit E2 n=1 Tax=Candidatus Portiera aleyrodidarum TaxID=91844 RepID=UPI0005D7F90D|nr:2-oxo acid dehydrogenase subunit E2 [Candidatus Portiera aleyrodidarum]CEL12421.1 Dihydrolipoyllysine-residue acetyltransferase component of pyruvate dehydrogenase complex [Candidatus Portiera aleyrodidarum]
MIIELPEIGDINKKVEVIEILVKIDDYVKKDDIIVVLESEKATIDLPTPKSGKIKKILIKEGDKIYSGNSIIEIEEDIVNVNKKINKIDLKKENNKNITVHAGPSVRLMARKLGIDLEKNQIIGTGKKNRILKEDLQDFIKNKKKDKKSISNNFGSIEEKNINKILSINAKKLHDSWITIPHVTHFDEVDITKLEEFRKKIKYESGVKITLLSFLIKICSCALKKFKKFNMSYDLNKNKFLLKKYINISVAINTLKGLLVPVIRNVDEKNIIDIAIELKNLTKRTLLGKNKLEDMNGSCFTISNLGSIGGKGFTPIINNSELGILGIGKSKIKPIWNGKKFKPKIILPIFISYDHRFINGVYAAKFINFIIKLLIDIRNLIIY